MAKLARESRLRERRVEKQARKDARKQAAADRPAEGIDTQQSPDLEAAETAHEPSPSLGGPGLADA